MKCKFFGLGNLFVKDGVEDKALPEGPVDFEDAIAATKFGKFNIMLVGFACLSAHAFIFDTTVPPYIIPSAECDLQISLLDKGILNGISHAGMICSAPIVGYLADTIGRQKILFWGLFVDAICNISATFSHSFMLSLLLKFTAGFFVGGTNTVVISMIAEFHSARIRPSLVMLTGLWFSLAMLVVPLMALLFLVNPFNTSFGENYEFHSWQIFWGVMSVPATLGALLAFFIPESPRFLISRNRTAEALTVLRKVYSINTGLPPDTYPVKELKLIHNPEKDAKSPLEESESKGEVIQEMGGVREESTWGAIKGGLRQLRPLLRPPHLPNVLIMFMVHFGGVMGCNSLRLWLPQLFKMMSDYEAAGTDGSLCDMISFGNQTIAQRPWPEDGICEPIHVKPDTYINSVIVASVQVALCAVASIFINTIGKRRLLVSALMCGGICTISLYWCTSTVQATALASVTVAFTAICMNAVLSIAVDLFPTALRAMAVSLIMMLGRIGSITGSVAFPALLATGCLTPFLTLGLILIGGGLIALLIPAPTKHAT